MFSINRESRTFYAFLETGENRSSSGNNLTDTAFFRSDIAVFLNCNFHWFLKTHKKFDFRDLSKPAIVRENFSFMDITKLVSMI